MKRFIVLLLLVSFSFSLDFGNSQIEVSREWEITGIPEDSEINFTGMLVVNNSNQKVLEVYAGPPLSIHSEGEKIFVVYNGIADSDLSFNARAVVLVDYDTDLKKDEPLPGEKISGSELTMWDDEIEKISDEVSTSSSALKTIRDVANWVHENMVYDLGYFGLSESAQSVIKIRRGVCVEYTHLTISMLNALGLKTRYVGGYVMTDYWQPHSWAEVYVDGQWIALDSTFNEAGILDNSHVALSYGNDSADVYDKIISFGGPMLTSSTELRVLEQNEDPKGALVRLLFNNQTYTLIVEVENTRDDYLFGTYNRAVPEEYGGQKEEIVLLEPGETYREYVVFPQEQLTEGYSYTIPSRASFNDASDMENISIVREITSEEDEICSSFFILLIIPIGIFLSEIIKNN